MLILGLQNTDFQFSNFSCLDIVPEFGYLMLPVQILLSIYYTHNAGRFQPFWYTLYRVIAPRQTNCDALPQNSSGTSLILGKMSFFDILYVKSTLSALIWYQNQVHTFHTFWDINICVEDHKHFFLKCDFEKLSLKVSYSYSFEYMYDRLRKMQKFF